jgi:hypothetical protein
MCDYTLKNKAYILSVNEQTIIKNNPPKVKEDWGKKVFIPIKENLKKHVYYHQHDRCAYCRKIIEAGAYYEPLEHIVAKSVKPEWLINPANLIVTCDRCNNLKGDEQTLAPGYETSTDLPQSSEAYITFNPYYDHWSEHLSIEDDIFIVPVPNSKGATTIKICKLFKYNIIVNLAKEKNLGQKSPLSKTLHRLAILDKNSDTYNDTFNELIVAMTHFSDRMIDIPDFD